MCVGSIVLRNPSCTLLRHVQRRRRPRLNRRVERLLAGISENDSIGVPPQIHAVHVARSELASQDVAHLATRQLLRRNGLSNTHRSPPGRETQGM